MTPANSFHGIRWGHLLEISEPPYNMSHGQILVSDDSVGHDVAVNSGTLLGSAIEGTVLAVH